jgi:hypothetical protein
MADFKPSADFVGRTMENVHSYEKELSNKGPRIPQFLLSKPVLYALCAGGFLFAILNYVGMVSTLIFPAVCL